MASTVKRGLIEKCRKARGRLRTFVKGLAEFTGAHVLSLVRAHYPLIDLARLETGYTQGSTLESAKELRVAQMELSVKLTGDLELCGESPSRIQEPVETPSSSSQPTEPAVSTSQTPPGPSTLARPRSPGAMGGACTSEHQPPDASTSK